jgi:hypothetical protein
VRGNFFRAWLKNSYSHSPGWGSKEKGKEKKDLMISWKGQEKWMRKRK